MIAIIGSGLSGLTAAKVLKENNAPFVILEKTQRVGGRVKSDSVDGFILDHGFQVLLDSYPSVNKHLDLKELNLGFFNPGAKIFLKKEKSVIMSDPLRDPKKIVSTLLSPISTIKDGIKTLSLKNKREHSSISTLSFLKNFGFSERYINSFFKPFFSGIFLERELRSPANYFTFLFNRFSHGLASLPEGGMGKVTEQLASHSTNNLRLGYTVKSVELVEDKVYINRWDESEFVCDKVIFAIEAPAVSQLFPDFKLSQDKRVVTTVYFKTKAHIPDNQYLLLNGTGVGRVNHIAFVSSVSSSYAPQGQSLVSVNILDVDEVDPNEIISEIKLWGLGLAEDWLHLATYPIHYAQPDEFFQGQFKLSNDHFIFAGDYTETPSIEGAMLSGEKAALKAL